MKKIILSSILSGLVIGGLLVTAQSSAFGDESAEGQGVLVNEDDSQSQFSFNAKRNPNGKVTGTATLRNPSYKAGNGQTEKIKIDVTCLRLVGNVAIIGGMAKRKSNQAKAEAVYFAVEDSYEAAGADRIFRGFYFDDDPLTQGNAQLCQTIEPEILVLEPIVAGNIKVRVE
jgi:hypothetical protein